MHGKLALGALKGQFCFLGRSVCIGGRTPTQGAHPSAGATLGFARRAQWLTSIVAGGAYHPSPKPNVPRSAGVSAESPKRVWVDRLC